VARGASALDWLAAVDGYEALLVTDHGTVHQTAGVRALLQPVR
jgi:hypothetical protein